MLFSNSLLIAGLIVFTSASPAPAPEPTTPTAAQSQALVEDLQSYLSALETQPVLLSIASSLATDTAALNSLEALQQSLQSDILNGQAPNTAVLTALPSPIASLASSVYIAGLSIFSKDGFGDIVASATASEAAAGAAKTATATATATQNTSGTGIGNGTVTAGTVSPSSTGLATIEGAAGALGVDMLRICGGLAVGVVGVVMAL